MIIIDISHGFVDWRRFFVLRNDIVDAFSSKYDDIFLKRNAKAHLTSVMSLLVNLSAFSMTSNNRLFLFFRRCQGALEAFITYGCSVMYINSTITIRPSVYTTSGE